MCTLKLEIAFELELGLEPDLEIQLERGPDPELDLELELTLRELGLKFKLERKV